MRVGDLVFCQGYLGLVLESHITRRYSEHFIHWFGLKEENPACWVSERQLTKVG